MRTFLLNKDSMSWQHQFTSVGLPCVQASAGSATCIYNMESQHRNRKEEQRQHCAPTMVGSNMAH